MLPIPRKLCGLLRVLAADTPWGVLCRINFDTAVALLNWRAYDLPDRVDLSAFV